MRVPIHGLAVLASCALLDAPALGKGKVLFLVDELQSQIARSAAAELKGKADFSLADQFTNTNQALEHLDKALGDKKWDVIYFNFGVGDLVCRDPKSKEFRTMSKYAGGVRMTSSEQYEENLDALVKRLKETGAKVIWGTSTPMANVNAFPGYTGNLFDQRSAKEYNAIAGKVMSRHQVPVCDLHTFIMSQYGEKDRHPGVNGYVRDMGKKKKPSPHKPLVEALAKLL